jgi:succinate-acetate transporter protein
VRSFVKGSIFARIRYLLGYGYVAFGITVIVQLVHSVGLRPEAVPGFVLGGALIWLGTIRIRAGVPARAQ